MKPAIVCFGAAHIDTKAVAQTKVMWGSKNPVSTTMSFGGVARNVAENLSRLSQSVALYSRVGNDYASELVLAKLKSYGIDTQFVSRSSCNKTASFTALLEPDGEMAVALSDMAIYDEITLSDEAVEAFHDARLWIVDANLCEETLLAIRRARPSSVSLWAVGTSVAKNPRFLSFIDAIDVLVVNEQESPIFLPLEPRKMVVTRGRHGAVFYDNGVAENFPCVVQEVTDATGAGDAFVAGLAYGYLRTSSLKDAIPYAHACARLTIKTYQSVCETLSEEMLLALLNRG